MKLYKLINKIGTYWVVAKDPTEAESKLMKLLEAGDGYGFSGDRVVREIHFIADQVIDTDRTDTAPILTHRHLVL